MFIKNSCNTESAGSKGGISSRPSMSTIHQAWQVCPRPAPEIFTVMVIKHKTIFRAHSNNKDLGQEGRCVGNDAAQSKCVLQRQEGRNTLFRFTKQSYMERSTIKVLAYTDLKNHTFLKCHFYFVIVRNFVLNFNVTFFVSKSIFLLFEFAWLMGNLPDHAPQQPITALLKGKASYLRDVSYVNVGA